MTSSRPSLPRLSVPPPIEPKSRALAYGFVSLMVMLGVVAAFKLGPRVYNAVRLHELSGRNVYDQQLEPENALAAARAQAQSEGRKVLVVLGGNWCQWCLALDDLMRNNEEIKAHLNRNFVVVKLDSAKAKALDEAWGKPTRFGVPVLIFLDANGKPKHVQETVSLERWGGKILAHDPDRLLLVLRNWS
ncbi:MAG TPA: thioredoxin family protein [Polyangiales bacterium]|nr:thioredoxin family protein [Polyangiales bacterium]